MKPLQLRLKQKAQETGSRFDIVEKDYALSYILAGLVSVEELRNGLVFKGGTSLKKCYFGDYRLPAKCEHRQVSYTHLEEFFTPELLFEVEQHWESQLGYYVKDLPAYQRFAEGTQRASGTLFGLK